MNSFRNLKALEFYILSINLGFTSDTFEHFLSQIKSKPLITPTDNATLFTTNPKLDQYLHWRSQILFHVSSRSWENVWVIVFGLKDRTVTRWCHERLLFASSWKESVALTYDINFRYCSVLSLLRKYSRLTSDPV